MICSYTNFAHQKVGAINKFNFETLSGEPSLHFKFFSAKNTP